MTKDNESQIIECVEEFYEGWEHFLGCIDFNHTTLDCRAIKWWNTVLPKMEQAMQAEKQARKEVTHEEVPEMLRDDHGG